MESIKREFPEIQQTDLATLQAVNTSRELEIVRRCLDCVYTQGYRDGNTDYGGVFV